MSEPISEADATAMRLFREIVLSEAAIERETDLFEKVRKYQALAGTLEFRSG